MAWCGQLPGSSVHSRPCFATLARTSANSRQNQIDRLQRRYLRFNAASQQQLVTDAERFAENLLSQDVLQPAAVKAGPNELEQQLKAAQCQVAELQQRIDAAYQSMFAGVSLPASEDMPANQFDTVTEQQFAQLGRDNPQLLAALLAAKQADSVAWSSFQSSVTDMVLQRTRTQAEVDALDRALDAARKQQALSSLTAEYEAVVSRSSVGQGPSDGVRQGAVRTVKIVMITGFESFNVSLYRKVAVQLSKACPGAVLNVFSDRDIAANREGVQAALKGADVFFGSLLFDFDQVEWVRASISAVPVRFVFESALELMSTTQVGSFQMAPSGKSAGPPPAVKKVLSMFGSGREEDRMVGYLSFLKIGPKLLKFLPGQKVRDLRNWLTVYGYWNQGGLDNVVNMFKYIITEYFQGLAASSTPVGTLIETPATGCLHPLAGKRYFSTAQEYLTWYRAQGPVRDPAAPTVAVLLYRKHVITDQPYIPELIQCLEAEGIRPVPIFINGVEAHTVVRDQLTTTNEQQLVRKGLNKNPTLNPDAPVVDALINTIGFPLVGGPAGTMEGGRQSEVAKAILEVKNVPYVVAAPLLIQDMGSWVRDGVAGLQSVVLYSLPELDGAIDTVPIGGLVGDNIYLVPERVTRLARRMQQWVNLRRKPMKERRLAILLYGFPPGVGATGTAALLNVPKSLEKLLEALREQGYDLGDVSPELCGETLITALKRQEEGRVMARGAAGVQQAGAGRAAEYGVQAVAREVSGRELRDLLRFPDGWGPTEWGPIPFLPSADILVERMERQWGNLASYRGLNTTASGSSLVSGLQFGNVWIGVQPPLGVEGDPMRLLFERDLTPHPQYAAFYKWLQDEYQADAVVHFGMHGTVEWLPGAPLGNTGFSWSDVLLGNMPNVYIYACNNPSESIIAKRRGYGTIVSHNVPAYGRAGLYKQLAELRALLVEYREGETGKAALKAPIVESLNLAGLQDDCPFADGSVGSMAVSLDSSMADGVDDAAFDAYVNKLYNYLLELENRLYSEGLHVLGQPPSQAQTLQYLSAYFGDDLPQGVLDQISCIPHNVPPATWDGIRQRLERAYAQPAASTSAASSPATVGPVAGVGDGHPSVAAQIAEAIRIKQLLEQNTQELTGAEAGVFMVVPFPYSLEGVIRALNGEYILPEAGGDLLRDGAGVLPTGRNIHALDPYRMPSMAALSRGTAIAEAVLQQHRDANGGVWPETVAVNLWGLDAIKTKGESVAVVLHLVGARPVREGTGRIARFELIPLEELGDRPRVDVLCNMSGIFRDSFQNVVELLDDMFQRAAGADEDPERNYIRKHAVAIQQQGVDGAAARLFSNPAGDFGSFVNEQVGASSWSDGRELGETWVARNAFSYGRGGERGAARPEVLRSLLATTDRVVQQVDSVEYGLTDIQEYYANTGALRKAAENAKGSSGETAVGCSIVEAYGKAVKPRELEEVLRIEYRTKLLNPKWAKAMAAQGSGGAFEISQRMTAIIGWGATANFTDQWVWDQAADTYAFDEEMAATLRKNNPQAFSNVVKRLLEAAGRGMWRPDDETVAKLQQLYEELDAELEGVQ